MEEELKEKLFQMLWDESTTLDNGSNVIFVGFDSNSEAVNKIYEVFKNDLDNGKS
jgi:hypothetical protein